MRSSRHTQGAHPDHPLLDPTRRHFAVREGDAFKIADMQVQTSRMPKWSPHFIVRPRLRHSLWWLDLAFFIGRCRRD